MQGHKKLSAQILSMAMSVAMVCTMMPATVFAAEGDVSLGTIRSFEKLEDRFQPSTGEGASKDTYALNVELNTPFEDLNLPDELTAMVERTAPAGDEPVVDSGKPSEPAEDETIPDEDTATDDTVSGNQPVSPSDAEENEEIKDESVPLAPEPEQDEETTATEPETIPVTWHSDKEYKSDENGTFIYTAVLPEGYTLADGVELLRIYVVVGRQARAGATATQRTTTLDLTTISTTDPMGATHSGGVYTHADEHWVYDTTQSPPVLTLSGVDFKVSAIAAIIIPASVTITAATGTTNKLEITVADAVSGIVHNGGVTSSTGNLLINGGGTLEIVVGQTTYGDLSHCIMISNSSVQTTIDSLTLKLNATTGYAVYGNDLTINSGSHYWTGGSGAATTGPLNGAITIANSLQVTGSAAVVTDGTGLTAAAPGGNTIKMGADGTGDKAKTVKIEAAPGPAITVQVNNGTAVGGDTLQAAITASNVVPTAVTSLKVTAGVVTEADWGYLKNLIAMTSFEIADSMDVTSVANIPNGIGSLQGQPSIPILPKSIVTVTVPQAVTIGNNAFEECSALTSVSFPEATSFGDSTFYYCTSLTSASFPKVTSINGKVSFGNCTSLTSVSFPKLTKIPETTFSNCPSLKSVSFPEATEILGSAFWLCPSLTSVSFPKLTNIGPSSFLNCTKLVTLKLGASAPTVGANAFKNCPVNRALGYVDANGNDLANNALTEAQAAYKAINDDSTTDNLWYGWMIKAPKIMFTAKIGGTDTVLSGDSLQTALADKDLTNITELKITFGEVTEADWKYLKSLTALTTFEIDAAVTDVANIPNGEKDYPILPKSIVTVTVPQAITIGDYAFNYCVALATINFPKATSIGSYAFAGCNALTTASFPAVTSIAEAAFFYCGQKLTTANFPVVTSIGDSAFAYCKALASASFPVVTSIEKNAFSDCSALATLKLGATPPETVGTDAFSGCPKTRALVYVGADGNALTGTALTNAQNAYDAIDDGATDFATDGKWYGWAVVPVTPPTPPSGGGGSSGSGGGSTPTPTPPSGGSADGVITPGKTVIDNPVGNQGSKNTLAEAVKNAIATGTTNPTVYTNFANYTALTKDGLKAINDATAAAVAGKNVQLNTKVQLDNKVGNAVVSRITVDPVKLAAVMPDKLRLGVWFNQKQDRQVTSVTNLFEKTFDNKIVTITFEQKSPLAVNMEFSAKPDLSTLNTSTLYFYSYDPVKNAYNRIAAPNYRIDKNGYSHITAPLGGSIIISDELLTKK